jgi:hypothetical protein
VTYEGQLIHASNRLSAGPCGALRQFSVSPIRYTHEPAPRPSARLYPSALP